MADKDLIDALQTALKEQGRQIGAMIDLVKDNSHNIIQHAKIMRLDQIDINNLKKRVKKIETTVEKRD